MEFLKKKLKKRKNSGSDITKKSLTVFILKFEWIIYIYFWRDLKKNKKFAGIIFSAALIFNYVCCIFSLLIPNKMSVSLSLYISCTILAVTQSSRSLREQNCSYFLSGRIHIRSQQQLQWHQTITLMHAEGGPIALPTYHERHTQAHVHAHKHILLYTLCRLLYILIVAMFIINRGKKHPI